MRRGLRGRRLGFLLLAVSAAAMLMYTGDAMWLWVLLLQLFTLLIGAVQVAATLFFIDISAEALPAVTTSGGTARLTLTIKNPTPLPLCHLTISYSVATTAFDGRLRTLYAAAPFGVIQKSFDIVLPYRGSYTLGPTRIAAVDLFGLVRASRRLNTAVNLLVYPNTGTTPLLNSGGNEGGAYLSQRRATDELTQISDIRDYRAGDPPRHIHWKLSERFSRLLVKDYSGAAEVQSTVILDCSYHGLDGIEAAAYEDALCSCAASFAETLEKNGRQVRLTTYGASGATHAQSDYLPHLARLRFGGDIGAAEAVRLERDGLKSVVVITREPTTALCERLCELASAGARAALMLVIRGEVPRPVIATADELRRAGVEVFVPGVEI